MLSQTKWYPKLANMASTTSNLTEHGEQTSDDVTFSSQDGEFAEQLEIYQTAREYEQTDEPSDLEKSIEDSGCRHRQNQYDENSLHLENGLCFFGSPWLPLFRRLFLLEGQEFGIGALHHLSNCDENKIGVSLRPIFLAHEKLNQSLSGNYPRTPSESDWHLLEPPRIRGQKLRSDTREDISDSLPPLIDPLVC